MTKYKRFDRNFKLSILREIGTRPLAEICREHDLNPNVISRWKREYRQNPQEAFAGNGKLWKEEAKVAERERLIGQLYAENAFLKKALERLQQQKIEEGGM